MTVVFSGKAYASGKEEELKEKVLKLTKKGAVPKLISIIVGDNPASILYVNLKKKAAERIGAEVKVVRFDKALNPARIIQSIKQYNEDPKVNGIMVQLPLPDPVSSFKLKIINSIDPKKDIDGLRKNSFYVHPTAKAVIEIIEQANSRFRDQSSRYQVCIVGEKGMVGSSLVKEIKKMGFRLTGDTNAADILISATGSPGSVKKDMVKKGVVVVDVGSPLGDVDLATADKASFITPVPGGVGPVTVSCLLENLIIACYTGSL